MLIRLILVQPFLYTLFRYYISLIYLNYNKYAL
jgi:hypothetical protein